MPLMPFTLGIEGDGSGGGDDENKGETVPKADFETVSGERDKLQKELDDTKGEIFTPSYMKFLDDKDKPPVVKDDDKPPVISDDKFEKMTNKEVYELATKDALAQFNTVRDTERATRKKDSDNATASEIARFAKTHDDYERFRPAMYGLSLKAENKDLSLQALYDKSKEYVKSLQEGPTAEEIKKQQSMDGMKPGNSSGTYTSEKKVDGDTAAKEAATEVAAELGPLPSA